MKPYGWRMRANAYVGRPERLERVVLKKRGRRIRGDDLAASAHVLQEIRTRRAAFVKRPPRRKRLPRQIPPDAVILSYRAALLTYVKEAQAVLRRRLFPELATIAREAKEERGDSLRMDASGKRTKRAMEEVRKAFDAAFPDRRLEEVAEDMARRTNRHNREQLSRQLKAAVGVDVVGAEPRLQPLVDNFVTQNVSLIKSIPARMFDEVEARVQSGVTLGLRHEDMAEDIEKRFGVSESRAELIARDQTLTFYGSLNEVRQKALGLEFYIWRTARDERVRPEHAEREGKRYQWGDPEEEIPGEAVACRCFAEPDVEALLESL